MQILAGQSNPYSNGASGAVLFAGIGPVTGPTVMKQLLFGLAIWFSVAYNTATVCADAVEDLLSQVNTRVEQVLRSRR